jgi:hypothetical protein
MLPHPIVTRWNSVFLRRHLRHAPVLATSVRVIMSAVMLYAQGKTRSDSFSLIGSGTSMCMIARTMTVASVDARRIGARDVMANLGYSRGELAARSAIPPARLEIGIGAAPGGRLRREALRQPAPGRCRRDRQPAGHRGMPVASLTHALRWAAPARRDRHRAASGDPDRG